MAEEVRRALIEYAATRAAGAQPSTWSRSRSRSLRAWVRSGRRGGRCFALHGGCRANECARLQIGAVVPLLGHMIVCLPLTRSSPQRRVLAAIDKKEASL